MPARTNDRLLYLCWQGSDEEWLLVEDLETTENSRSDLAVNGKEDKGLTTERFVVNLPLLAGWIARPVLDKAK